MLQLVVIFVWILLIAFCRWFQVHDFLLGKTGMDVAMIISVLVADGVLALPLLFHRTYRSPQFVVYLALSTGLGGLVLNAWWCGIATWLVSLPLSILALGLEDLVHRRFFGDRPGHGLWLLVGLHVLLLVPFIPPLAEVLGFSDVMVLAVWAPVTVWRVVCTILGLGRHQSPEARCRHITSTALPPTR